MEHGSVPLCTGLDILALCLLHEVGVLADGQNSDEVRESLLSHDRLAPSSFDEKGREWWRPFFSSSPNTGESLCPVLIGGPGIGKTSQMSYLARELLREAYRGLPTAVKVIPGALFRQGTVAGIEGLDHEAGTVETYQASIIRSLNTLVRENARVVVFVDEVDLVPYQLQCYLQQFISRGEEVRLPDRVTLCAARNIAGQNAEDELPEATRSRMIEIPVHGKILVSRWAPESSDMPPAWVGRTIAAAVEPTLSRIVRPYVRFVKTEHRFQAYEAAVQLIRSALQQAYGDAVEGDSNRELNRVAGILQTALALQAALPQSPEYDETRETAVKVATEVVPKLVLGDNNEVAAILEKPLPDLHLFTTDPCGFAAKHPQDVVTKALAILVARANGNNEATASLIQVATAFSQAGEGYARFAKEAVLAAERAGLEIRWPDWVQATIHDGQ